MKNKKVVFMCQNILMFKEKLSAAFMFIKNKGYDIFLICNEDADIPFVEKKFIIDSLSKNMNSLSLKKEIDSVKEIIINENIDVVETLDNISSYIMHYALKKIKTNIIKNFSYVDDVKQNISKFKDIIINADKVIVNNEEDYNFLISKNYNSDINLIYDIAIDFRKFNNVDFDAQKSSLKEKYNLLDDVKYVAIIDEEENYNYISNVIKEIMSQNSDVRFLIKDIDKNLMEKLEKNGVLEYVQIIGDIKYLDLLLVSNSALFTDLNSYSMSVFIYSLMLGIPVIVPRKDFLEEYIKELTNGFFFIEKNVQQTVLAIGRSINIPKVKLEGLKKFNYGIINKFSSEKYTYAISKLYEEVSEDIRKDIYIIDSLKKKENAEILIGHIEENSPKDALIITIKSSKNDEKIEKLGAIVKTLSIDTLSDKIKFRKYLNELFKSRKYNMISIYGIMNKVIRENKIYIEDENIVTRYSSYLRKS